MIKEEVVKMEPSAEEKQELEEEEVQEEEEEEEEEEKADDSSNAEEEEDGDDEEQEVRVDKTANKTGKTTPLPVKAKKEQGTEGLNLNNEVVRMRKEVKRVRALIIRKLTRQIGALKKKKGKTTEIERNQQRAARLLKEIHAIKALSPDLVTKTALQKNLNFEAECKNPKSTISDRAVARIGTHPQFKKKIDAIKAAVKAFKDERMKGGKIVVKEKVEKKTANVTPQSPDKRTELTSNKEEDVTVEEKEIIESEGEDGILKDATEPALTGSKKETSKAMHLAESADVEKKELPETLNVKPATMTSSQVEDIVKNEPQIKISNKKPDQKSAPEVLQKNKEEDESDLESLDDEEKEYFDDSTEERFHKQSSQSEDSEDDFFIGKVSKFKNKKPKGVEGVKENKVKKDPTDEVQSKCNELESRLKSKSTSMQSVFCSSLSVSKPGGRTGRGRGGDKFRGQGKPRGNGGLNRDFRKQSKVQELEKGTESNSVSRYSKPESSERGFPSAGRGRGRGRGAGMMQKDHRGGGVSSQQALHPSWEASKKRKEQQGQILAFQGKKIKFDDD